MIEQLLNKKQAAATLNCSVALLNRWICYGGGPAHVKLNGKIVRYTKESLDAFVRAHTVRSTNPLGTEVAA